MNNKRQKTMRIISIILIVVMAVKIFDFTVSEITDNWAYEDATANESAWVEAYAKLLANEKLSNEDYEIIFEQSGLAKPAVDSLIAEKKETEIEKYRDYYLQDKDFECIRTAIFAHHEAITNSDGKRIANPDFADLQNGDIIVTLSIHSLGWRHGHAAIVTDAEKGEIAQAVRIFEKSALGTVWEFNEFPLVALLRVKNIDEKTQNEVAAFVSENMIGINYALSAGLIGGRDTESVPFTTQCAHFVWYAYKCFGVDLDENDGMVTPKDLLHSNDLEVVQVYGNIMEL